MAETLTLHPDKTQSIHRRDAWRSRREKMETSRLKSTPLGNRKIKHWKDSLLLFSAFSGIVRVLGLYDRGARNAAEIKLRRIDLEFESLPVEFEGFSILHISDLHLDRMVESIDSICRLLADIDADVCVLTGDFQDDTELPSDAVMPMLAKLINAMRVRNGVFGILGNHDRATAVESLERLGVTCLINESVSLTRGEAELYLTGTDDVHYFYTDAVPRALSELSDEFKIALVHSPEVADLAEQNGYSLYLTGHTHCGQICLPGGRPILTHLTRFREYAVGLWRHGRMIGYTSAGLGVSGLPLRYNTQGEIALISLRRAGSP